MDIDPHTLQQILQRIHQQMRCPQCGKRVPIDFSSVRVVANDAMLLQLKCDSCNAYIVLHASLQGMEKLGVKAAIENDGLQNASSGLALGNDEARGIADALEGAGGSFEKLFSSKESSALPPQKKTDIV